jgi:outer membrane protein assembly factor BamB
MTLIDLGEVGDFDPEAAPSPGPPRWLRGLGIQARGKAAAAAGVTLVAGALASGPAGLLPDPPTHTIATHVEGQVVAVDGIVLRMTDATSASAIDLATGRVRWTSSMTRNAWRVDPFEGAAAGGRTVGLIVVQTVSDPDYDNANPPPENLRILAAGTITALDPRSGKEIWHQTGALISPQNSGQLVALRRAGDSWRIAGLDPSDGHALWSVVSPDDMRFVYVSDDAPLAVGGDAGDLIVMKPQNGTVTRIDAHGVLHEIGRVAPGGDLEWAWSDYLAVSWPASLTPDGRQPVRTFELHDMRTLTPQPMWSDTIEQTGSFPWPCGLADRLCEARGAVIAEIGLHDGTVLGVHRVPVDPGAELSRPGALGNWTTVAGWEDDQTRLVSIGPSLSATGVGWLGVARLDGGRTRITPLMRTPMAMTTCRMADDVWLVCTGIEQDGTPWDHSLVLRKSDVDTLIRRLGG